MWLKNNILFEIIESALKSELFVAILIKNCWSIQKFFLGKVMWLSNRVNKLLSEFSISVIGQQLSGCVDSSNQISYLVRLYICFGIYTFSEMN